jgi:hypothetical protein
MAPTWAIMSPRWPQHGPICSRDGPKMGQDGPKMPKTGPTWAKMGLRWAKMAPRWLKHAQDWANMGQDGPKMGLIWAKKTPRWPQDGPKMAPKSVSKRGREKELLFHEKPPKPLIVIRCLKKTQIRQLSTGRDFSFPLPRPLPFFILKKLLCGKHREYNVHRLKSASRHPPAPSCQGPPGCGASFQSPRWPQYSPRWPQHGPKTTQHGPRWPQDRPKMAPRQHKMATTSDPLVLGSP